MPGVFGEAEQPLRGHSEPGRGPVKAGTGVAQFGDGPDVPRRGGQDLGGALGERRGVGVVLAFDDGQREPRSMSWRRVRAIFDKELREYRHNGNIVYAMIILPLLFLIQPLIQIFALPSSASATLHHEHTLIYMLAIPGVY